MKSFKMVIVLIFSVSYVLRVLYNIFIKKAQKNILPRKKLLNGDRKQLFVFFPNGIVKALLLFNNSLQLLETKVLDF